MACYCERAQREIGPSPKCSVFTACVFLGRKKISVSYHSQTVYVGMAQVKSHVICRQNITKLVEHDLPNQKYTVAVASRPLSNAIYLSCYAWQVIHPLFHIFCVFFLFVKVNDLLKSSITLIFSLVCITSKQSFSHYTLLGQSEQKAEEKRHISHVFGDILWVYVRSCIVMPAKSCTQMRYFCWVLPRFTHYEKWV